MRKTNQGNTNGFSSNYLNPIAVDTAGLQTILGCGRNTAIQIGTGAAAKVIVGKRVLWNVEKIQGYLNRASTR